MSGDKNLRIVFIGSGAVATHTSQAFKQAKYEIVQVYSKQFDHAQLLAQSLGCEAIDDLKYLQNDVDIYVLAVSDHAIESLIEKIPANNALWLHTAGSISMNIFANKFTNYGVLYPLQTFSKIKAVDFKNVPLCIEANDENTLFTIEKLAKSISHKVYKIKEQQRQILHVSAVFACNFVNFLYANAHELLKEHEIPFEIIKPLIKETAEKVMTHIPKEVQTGPAVRNDVNTMANHLELLRNHPDILQIYNTLSSQIVDIYK